MWALISSNANLVVFAERIRFANTAVAQKNSIMHGLSRDQIQGTLQRFARGLGSKCFLGSPKLHWIQSGRNLNESHTSLLPWTIIPSPLFTM